ncbi:hypothetical protein SNE40_003256 [Patella caerulea]|uniref:Uncharacterized protein n=1 Tax=Patella caerulea TaxID=87958 RepID=A0AAN8Q8E6_PATCE
MPKISQEDTARLTDLDSDAKECLNWADDLTEDEAVDIPEWAMNRNLFFNRQRINAKSYFMDVVFGLATVWE